MKNVGSLVFAFLVGGFVIASVKYLSTTVHNPGLAAIIGGLPTGLLTMYLISRQDSVTYSNSYFYNTLILASAIMAFYLMTIYTEWNKNLTLTLAIGIWSSLVTVHYLMQRK